MATKGDVSRFLKQFLFLYAFGLVLALQVTSLMEFFGSFSIPWPIRTFSVAAGIPLLVVYLGRRFLPRPAPKLGFRTWGLNALALTLFWAGGYFIVGALSYSGEFYSMGIGLDEKIPFYPEWVFIYLTVYGFFLIPLFYVDDLKQLVILDLSQVLALSISYTTFIIYPVAIDRPGVVPADFATWALSLVQAQDPPWNCFPSTHCTACTVAAFALVRAKPAFGWWAIPSTVGIYVSTVLTKQHFVLDALAGVVLGSVLYLAVTLLVEKSSWGKRIMARLA